MYRQYAFNFGWRTLFFALVIHNFYQLTLSASSICTNQNIVITVVEGQNVSIDTFHLERPLLENQFIVWEKQNETWKCTHNLLCTGLNHTRYKLIEGMHNKILKILIEHAQKSDEGTHVIRVYEGSRYKCVILSLNLTVTDPPSDSTTFLRYKMSCQLVQNTEGENVNVLLTEKAKNGPNQNSNMTFDNAVCNSANNFTVYLDFQEILFVTQNSPSDCGVSKRNKIENKIKSCKFDSLEVPTFLNDQARIVFEHCNGNGEMRKKWWYVHNGGHELLPLPQNYQFHDNNAEFLCESHPSSKVHNIARLNLRQPNNTCTSVFEEAVYSSTISNCTKLIFNVSTASPPTTSLISTKTNKFANRILSTGTCDSFTLLQKISGECAEKEKNIFIFICLVSISTSALVFSITYCFFKCKFIRGGGDLSKHPLNSQAARHGGDTEHAQTTPFVHSQNLPQLVSKETWIQSDTTNQASVIDKEKHDHGQECGPSSSECQSETLELHSRSVVVEHHTLPGTLTDLGNPSSSTDDDKCDELHIGTSHQSCVDSSYCSMDDAKDISGNSVQLPSTPPPLPCSLSSSNERRARREGNNSLDVKEEPSCLVKPKIRGEDMLVSGALVRSVPIEPSRLKMITPDLDYDDVRNPRDSIIESSIANTSRRSEPIYEYCD